jgi:hypothetical protein
MSDRSPVEVTLYGVAGHEQEIVELFEGFGVEWSGELTTEDVVDGVNVTDDEYALGCLPSEFGPALEAMGVSYYGEQSSRYEYAAEVRMFTPELGVFCSDSNGEGVPLVNSTSIDDAIATYEAAPVGLSFLAMVESTTKLVLRLEELSGKRHRVVFDRLQKEASA